MTDLLPFRENNPSKHDLRAKAETFMAQHPEVYRLFERFALEAASRGRTFGAKALAERVRWETMLTWSPDDTGYRWNNNYTAYVARRLVEDHPRLESLMRFRRTRW